MMEEIKLENINPIATPADIENNVIAKPKKLKTTFVNEYLDFSQRTTIHGLQHTGEENSNQRRKFVWAILVMGCFIGVMFMAINQAITFYTYPLTTKISRHLNSSIDFPAVTICNVNRYNSSLVRTFLDEDAEDDYRTEVLLKADAGYKDKVNWSDPYYDIYRDVLQPEQVSPFNTSLLMDPWQTIVCSYGGEKFDCEEAFTEIMTEMGRCLTFNSEEHSNRKNHQSYIANRAGNENGLLVMFDVRQKHYWFDSGRSAGLKAYVHDPHQYPMVRDRGFAISPGSETFADIYPTKVNFLGIPYSNESCLSGSGDSNTLDYFSHYSQQMCKLECAIKYVTKKCKCRLDYMRHTLGGNSTVICNVYDKLYCAQPELDAFVYEDCDCPRECFTITYGTAVHSTIYPSNFMGKLIEETFNDTMEYSKSNFILLRVFFGKLETTIIEQLPQMTKENLETGTGGLLGLFIGASVLTLLEVFELIGFSINYNINKYIRKTYDIN